MSFNKVTKKGYAFVLIFVFLSPFIIAIGAVYYIGYTNEQKVQEYFAQNQCQTIYNYKGRYKALCKDELVILNDYFIVDFDTNLTYNYSTIKGVEQDENKLYINSNDLGLIVEFETQQHSKLFMQNLQIKMKN